MKNGDRVEKDVFLSWQGNVHIIKLHQTLYSDVPHRVCQSQFFFNATFKLFLAFFLKALFFLDLIFFAPLRTLSGSFSFSGLTSQLFTYFGILHCSCDAPMSST